MAGIIVFLIALCFFGLFRFTIHSLQKIRELINQTSRIRKSGFNKLRTPYDYDNANYDIGSVEQTFLGGTDIWATLVLFFTIKVPSERENPHYYENKEFAKHAKWLKIYRWAWFIILESMFIGIGVSSLLH
jgi:hypothetical protein